MTAFLLSLLGVGGVALVASSIGWVIARSLFPGRAEFRLERLGWSCALGFSLLAAVVPISFLVGVRPGWVSFLILGLVLLALARFISHLTLPSPPAGGRGDGLLPLPAGQGRGEGGVQVLLYLLILLGVIVYALRALTEPMWSNDFLAIWGLKGKTIYGSAAVPSRLFDSPDLGFSHPEYPLGLPFLYAGISFLTARWDDHAMALLFPLFQLATLAVLLGWLRRHGASRLSVLFAAAIVANFEPLYSGFLTGLAEVPLSFGLLLFGTALCDAMEPGETGSLRRLALAAAMIAATKNEGLFFAVAGCALAVAFGGRRRWRIALAALPTALVVHGLHLAWRGRLPLRDFDFSSFSAARLFEALAAAVRVVGPSGWIGAGLAVTLIVLGYRGPIADRLLALAACAVAAYLILPAFAVRGPDWLVETTLVRISAGLAPLIAAAIALRFTASSEPQRDSANGPPVDPPDARNIPERLDAVAHDPDLGLRGVEPEHRHFGDR